MLASWEALCLNKHRRLWLVVPPNGSPSRKDISDTDYIRLGLKGRAKMSPNPIPLWAQRGNMQPKAPPSIIKPAWAHVEGKASPPDPLHKTEPPLCLSFLVRNK